MYKPSTGDLAAFAAVARHRSFRRAADALGMSRSAVSHAILNLEHRLGVKLLHRTTRSVAPTDLGLRLLDRLVPVLRELDAAIDSISENGGAVGGALRINCGETATAILLRSIVPAFLSRFPEVELELATDGRMIDIVAEGFDAGVRLRASVPQDMIALQFGGDARLLTVASPDYLARRGVPHVPEDLAAHTCIRRRLASGKPFRWQFEKQGRVVTLDVPGKLLLYQARPMIEAAVRGLGIAFVYEASVTEPLQSGALRPVLEDWCPTMPGFCLYYPRHVRVPAALRAFIDTIAATERLRRGSKTALSSTAEPTA